MRRSLGVIVAVLAAGSVPTGTALANQTGTDCGYTRTDGEKPTATVYTDDGTTGGTTGTADVSAGACLDLDNGILDGGTVEVGAGDDPGPGTTVTDAYAIIDGDDDNSVTGQEDGYVGLSNYETGASTDADCAGNGPDQGAANSSNSGGCIGIDGGLWVPLPTVIPTPICGNTSGPKWDGSSRDGAEHSCFLEFG